MAPAIPFIAAAATGAGVFSAAGALGAGTLLAGGLGLAAGASSLSQKAPKAPQPAKIILPPATNLPSTSLAPANIANPTQAQQEGALQQAQQRIASGLALPSIQSTTSLSSPVVSQTTLLGQ